jgi:predicted tellurium resistance membrane protein TerC
VQIIFLDVVFALDSIITAVGMVEHLWVMVVAVVIAMIIMLVAADPVGNFVNNHPTVKMLALSFLLLVGVALVADGLHFHIPRGYLYFAIAFSALVEALNLLAARRRQRFRLKASGAIVDEMAVRSEAD